MSAEPYQGDTQQHTLRNRLAAVIQKQNVSKYCGTIQAATKRT